MPPEQSPKAEPTSFEYETVYGTQLLQLAQKLRAKESRWTLIIGAPNQVVLSAGADSLVRQIQNDFGLPMTEMSSEIFKLSKESIDGGN